MPSSLIETSPPSGEKTGLNAATQSLLTKADHAIAQQQFGQANELIERAIRISPRSPYAYEALAQLRYKEGRYIEVEALIRKAALLARNLSVSREKKALLDDLDTLSRRVENE